MKTLFFFIFIAFSQVSFLPTLVKTEVQQNPTQVIRELTERVMATITEQKRLHGEKVTEQMVKALIVVLKPVVDFQAISRSVMGKHAKKANTQQIQKFTKVFTKSLVNFYMKSLITFKVKAVIVLEQDPDFNLDSNRATVRMEATDIDNSSYDLRYSMRTNSKGEWKVRNFLVEGINIGLTFLNQFDSAMARHGNDIDTVIVNWNDEMVQSEEGSQLL